MKSMFLLLTASFLFNSFGVPEKYESLKGFYNNMYIVEKGNQTVCVDGNNSYVMPFDFLNTPSFSIEEDSYYFKYNDSLYINKLPDGTDILYELSDAYVRGLKVEKDENNYYGVKDCEGNIIIPFEYEELSPSGEYYKAKKDGKYFIINTRNEIVSLYENDKKDNFTIVKKDNLYALINKEGKKVIPYAEGVLKFLSEDTVRRGNEMSGFPNELFDTDGNIIISKEENLSIFAVYDNNILVRALKNNKMGVVSKDKKIIIPFRYNLLYRPKQDIDTYYAVKNNKYGLITDGEARMSDTEFQVQQIDICGYIYATEKNSDYKWIVFSPKGIPQLYIEAKKVYPSASSLLIHTKDNKFIILPRKPFGDGGRSHLGAIWERTFFDIIILTAK